MSHPEFYNKTNTLSFSQQLVKNEPLAVVVRPRQRHCTTNAKRFDPFKALKQKYLLSKMNDFETPKAVFYISILPFFTYFISAKPL